MMLLLPGNAKALLQIIDITSGAYGWLLTPKHTMTKTGLYRLHYAVDNEMFTLGDLFDSTRFVRALSRIKQCHGIDKCLFVVAPDVPFNARATLRRFDRWEKAIHNLGFPVALAAQDGLEHLDIPWTRFEALFIGGTTQWKLGATVAELIRQARSKGKWAHMGRINSVKRASRIREHPDSVDGTAWAKHPAEYARQWQLWIDTGKPSFVDVMI